ncbi:MAG: hypothetical protein AMJ53_18615 [Gammaproteobacteria bacterium SG8_11]|nr:MAG: hypothetical protein AMJ53_18615 [Gammaproteobacteria bacterium SG8_11]
MVAYGRIRWLHGNNEGEIIDAWHPGLQADEAANDSDKTFTVTATEEWQIQSIWVELATSGDVGNRQLVIEIQDSGSDVIFQVRAGAVQAASTTYYYAFGPHLIDLTAVRDTDYLSTPMPALILPAGYIVRIYDNNAVAAAADDMVCQMLVNVRDEII